MNEVDAVGQEAYELFQGDQITVGVTHEIKIGYDKSWVKYEAVTKVRPGETAAGARTRAIGHVNVSSKEAVLETVENVRNMR